MGQTEAWVGRDIDPLVNHFSLSPKAVEELRDIAENFADFDVENKARESAGSLLGKLTETQLTMDKARAELDSGLGFAVVDGIPVEGMDEVQCRVLAWALFSCIGRVVDQKVTGSRVYDVQDKGVSLEYGVRRSITNLNQEFHTDAGWLDMPPELIGLFCRRPAEEGGLNQLLSLRTVHERLGKEAPDHLKRLYAPFWWDRQSEHAPEESKASSQPVFYEANGRLNVRYYDDYIRKGQELAGVALDDEGAEALAAMRAVCEDPNMQIEFGLNCGQYLLVNNREVAHSRSAFSGLNGQRSQRHYFRLWSRQEGTLRLDG